MIVAFREPIQVQRMTSGSLCEGNRIVLDEDLLHHSVLNADALAETTPTDLLPMLRKRLGSKAAYVSDNNLMKFLYWKPDVERAAERFEAHQKWIHENPGIFATTPLQASQDDALKRVMEGETFMSPDGAIAKDGSTVIMGKMKYNDMKDGRTPNDVVRLILYTLSRAMERESTQKNGITVFHDMKDVTINNSHRGIPKVLIRAILGHFPIRISGVYMLNAPGFIRKLFNVVFYLMPSKVRSRFHFVDDISTIHKVIGKESLLGEHGGTLQHDQVEWVGRQIEREMDDSVESLREFVSS